MARVRAIVLNYNGGDAVLSCVGHLLATEWPAADLDVVVVDNASADGSDDRIEERFPDVSVLRTGSNRGFPANNVAMHDLDDADFVALINNDAFVSPGWLKPLVEVLEDDPLIGAACPKILFDPAFVELTVRSPMFSLGGTDTRRLGARVSGIEVEGLDRWSSTQFADGFWGLEHGDGLESVFQWTNGEGRLRIPIDSAARDRGTARVRVAAPQTSEIVVSCGEDEATVSVAEVPKWVEVPLSGAPFDVVNNVGGVVLEDGSGADRGFLQPDVGQFDEPVDVFNWCGAGVLFRRAYLRDVGLFDERFFMYYEDTDLSWRGQARAWRYRYVPTSVIRHLHAATSVEGSDMFAHYVERNRLIMLLKNAPGRLAFRAPLQFLASTGSYFRRDVVYPMLLGREPRTLVVRRRLRSFLDYLRLFPTMLVGRLRLGRRRLVRQATLVQEAADLR